MANLSEKTLFRSIYCETNKRLTGSYYSNLAKCGARCKKFPCAKLGKNTYAQMKNSPLVNIAGGTFKRRKQRMYLFMLPDGTITPAYKGFDEKNPDWEELKDVKEVLFVSKTLVPQLKLVPKPKEERAAVPPAPTPAPESKPTKRRRNKEPA